jgi:hypothetical protein
VTLSPADVEAIAVRTAELLAERTPVSARFLSTARTAEILDVSQDWVREHAGELGAVRVGDGPRGELRFDLRRIERALEARRVDRPAAPAQRRRPGPRRGPRERPFPLLPIPGAS